MFICRMDVFHESQLQCLGKSLSGISSPLGVGIGNPIIGRGIKNNLRT